MSMETLAKRCVNCGGLMPSMNKKYCSKKCMSDHRKRIWNSYICNKNQLKVVI